jgi:hypothetical protein
MSSSPWILVTPRGGIARALTRRVLQTTKCPVVATARHDLDKTREEVLKGLEVDESRLTVLNLDVNGKPPLLGIPQNPILNFTFLKELTFTPR